MEVFNKSQIRSASMEIKKSLTYNIKDEKYIYILAPKDMDNVNIKEQEEIINKFFQTFDITISNIPVKIQPPTPPPRPARKKHETLIKIWNNVKQFLDNEFTANEYWEGLHNAGYDYKESTKEAIPYQHLDKLIEMNKIERISDRPAKWKKVFLRTSEEGVEETIKLLKEGKKVEMDVIK